MTYLDTERPASKAVTFRHKYAQETECPTDSKVSFGRIKPKLKPQVVGQR